MNKEIQKFTNEQKEIIEKTFDKFSTNTQRVKFLINMVNESLINIHGEFNPRISPECVSEILILAKELLEPADEILSELSTNGNYLLWDSNLKDISYYKINNKPHQA